MFRSKVLIILAFTLIISGCTSQKKVLSNPVLQQIVLSENAIINSKLSPNSKIETFKDSQKNTFIKIVPGNNIVVKIEAVKKSAKNVADSGYREIVYFEIPNKNQDIKMGDLKNSTIKMWFARFCFCRDYIGFYKITDGNLNIKLSKKALKIKAAIRFNNLPQVLNFIDQNLSLKQ
ncbi:MAG: hypothetical protein GXO84_06795 [Chlorobi bacterium]|nr:hypothetical protein [Chlorobiota bacterium]